MTQLEEISNDGIKLNRNDFEKCNSLFDNIADQQLINFMNTNSSLENSFADFIHSLPNEFNFQFNIFSKVSIFIQYSHRIDTNA